MNNLRNAAGIALVVLLSASAASSQPRAMNMRLVGHHGLQERWSYQPTLHQYGDRWLLFVGHHAGVVNLRRGRRVRSIDTDGRAVRGQRQVLRFDVLASQRLLPRGRTARASCHTARRERP